MSIPQLHHQFHQIQLKPQTVLYKFCVSTISFLAIILRLVLPSPSRYYHSNENPAASPLISIAALWYHRGILEFLSIPGESVFALVIWRWYTLLATAVTWTPFPLRAFISKFPTPIHPSSSGLSAPFPTSQSMKIEFCSFSFDMPRN